MFFAMKASVLFWYIRSIRLFTFIYWYGLLWFLYQFLQWWPLLCAEEPCSADKLHWQAVCLLICLEFWRKFQTWWEPGWWRRDHTAWRTETGFQCHLWVWQLCTWGVWYWTTIGYVCHSFLLQLFIIISHFLLGFIGVRLPTGNKTIYSYFIDMKTGNFVLWDVLVPSTQTLIEKSAIMSLGRVCDNLSQQLW